MRCFSITVLLQLIFFSSSFCELNLEKQDSFLNEFIDYLNSRPDQPYVYDDGLFLKSSQLDSNTYKIDIRVKVFKPQYPSSYHFQKCTATILDLGENGITIPNNEYQCIEWVGDETTPVPEGATTDAVQVSEELLVKEPIHLDNEVQPNNAPTSGEQFIAIPRDRSGPCIGCSSHVDPSAAGVDELAALGARHLDKHEPNVKHTVIAVHDVERQVQVTNGIRYILTLTVGYNNCTELSKDNCVSDKICKISIISKPWVKFPDGSKYKAILANNCTEQWLFGDDGEAVPETLDENKPTADSDKVANSGLPDDIIKAVHTADVQAHQHTQAPFSNEQIKNIQEQIIPYSEFDESRNSKRERATPNDSVLNKKKIENIESAKNPDEDTIQVRKPENLENTKYITEDKKKAIDDMLHLFNFAEFQPLHENTEDLSRGKRSYSSDLQVMSVLEKFQKIKRKLKNAKHIYKLGNLLVDYLNEMDMEVKTRLLKDVIFAEEEIEKDQHFFYIRVRVIIPCDKVECDSKDTQVKICNGVIDSTDSKVPVVVDTFCYDEEKKSNIGTVKNVPDDDPILLKLTNETIKKIEDDMYTHNALRVAKIINANTQKVSGTLTKISLVLEFIDCNKTVPFYKRSNCSTLQYLGNKICEAEIHERHWLKEKKITYTCADRPMDETVEENVYTSINKDTKNLQVIEIVKEALQILEVQSNRKNKQKIVEIKSVSTKIVAGQLINIDFVVGYTKCLINDLDIDLNNCELIEGEHLRKCQAQVWERPWLQEGRQIKVVCDSKNTVDIDEIENRRRKREIAGGITNVDANNPKYMKLAQESLSKYLQNFANTGTYAVIKVNKVATQVVAGLLTTIDFEVVGPGEVFSCKSEVWKPPGVTPKKITVTCGKDQMSRQKRQFPGAPQDEDPNDPKFMLFAQESLANYSQFSGLNLLSSKIQVNRVLRGLAAGYVYQMYFTVFPQDTIDVYNCYSEVWERLWLNKREITNVTCWQNNLSNRRKRDVLVGGSIVKDPKDEKYVKLAQESLSKYLQDSGNTEPHTVVKVDKVTVQIVSGTMTKIDFKVEGSEEVFSCESKVWERPWLKSKEITVSCGKDQNSRQERQIAGGEKEVDINDPKYMQLAQESLSKYLQDSGDTKPHTVVKVDNVTVQVVAGTLTRIEFKVQGAGEVFSCNSEVWERPWLKSKEITVNCRKDEISRQKRKITGGETEVDANDPKYMQLAQESLSKYLQDSGDTKPHTVLKVDKVTVQVVAGTLTRIEFKVQGAGEVFSCNSEVWERPWLKSKEITVNCRKDQISRQKRQITGSETEVDANDPEYMQLAQESLSKYLQDSGDTKPHTVLKVDKVTVQVVAGTLTRIEFKVQGAGEVFSCNSEVWERPWLKSKEITVNCRKDQISRQKRQITGGETEVDANDPEYMQLAQESLSKYLQDSGDTKPHTVLKVDKVTVQVVAGTLTRIEFKVQGAGEVFSCNSEVWERPWLKSKEITVNCRKDQISRQKRQITGGETEVDANDPEYMQLAQESLSKYLQDSGDTKPHTVLKVDKVTVQVVAGTLTRIEFKVQGAGEVFSCNSEVWERPWLKSKEITVNCRKDQISRQKRQITGGETEVDANDPEYMQLAQESLSKYLQDSGDTKPHTVLKVDKVTVQVVAGTLTRIEFKVQGAGEVFSCNSEVWERPWLKSKEITVNCRKDQISRQKRQITGGETEVDANDPEYMQLAQESLSKYLQDSGDTKPHTVLKVDKVTVQVVAGTLTRIEFKVQGAGEVFSCNSEVWERPWLKSKEITVNCRKDQISRQKRQITGGETEVDANDPEYMQLAQESLSKYLQDSGDTKPHTVLKVDKVTVQVVAGTLTRIEFKVQGAGEVFSCNSEVWERPWLKSKEITVNCRKDQISRQKRQITGGETEVDANDPEYMQLAQESLSKYLQDSGDTKPHTVLKVDKVTVQVVAGTLTRIEFKVQGAGEVFSCNSEVWERLWLKSKEITVNCRKDQISRQKRQIAGGETEVDANDPKYMQLAQESLSKYLQDSGDTKPHTVVKVDKVTVQVVAGTLTRIEFKVQDLDEVFSCNSEVWERPWLKSKEITVNCGKDQNSKQQKLKREIVVGGPVEEDPNDEKFIRLAEESLNKYVENIRSTLVHKLIELNRVTKQLVSGTITRLDFVISPTNCDVHDRSHKICSVLENANIHCHADIWERPWLKGDGKTIDVTCDDLKKNDESADNNLQAGNYASTEIKSDKKARDKNQYVKKRGRKSGDPVEQDPTKPLYRVLADEALRKYQLRKKSSEHHEITHVNRVVAQAVSGMKYNIEFEVLRISCALNEINKTQCDHRNNITLTCHAVIWSRPWLKSKQINVNCPSEDEGNEESEEDSLSEEIKRVKRGFGTTENKDPSDKTYVHLAKEAIKKYQKNVNADHIFKINKMLRVTEHVASGFVTNIDFSISPTTCLVSDHPVDGDNCQLQEPQVILRCSAEINEPSIPRTMRIKIGCKKRNKNKSDTQEQVILNREKRESPYDDDYVEEDIKYYYADRAITDFNSRASTNNLYKVVSIHDVHRSVHMDTLMVRLYLEIAMTYCMRYGEEHDLQNCDEIDGMSHKLCLARVYPSPDDELVVQHATMTCDDDKNFETISGISIDEFIRVSIAEIEKSPDIHYKLVPLGEPNVIPSLNYKMPIRMNFVVHHTNCSKDVDLNKTPTKCIINLQRSGRNCHSLIYLMPNSRNIQNVVVKCAIGKLTRAKRSVSLDPKNATADDLLVQQMVQESIEKLEMASEHNYKQRVLVINGYSSKIVSGRLTTIDFDVGYTTCLKYEWVVNTTSCEFLEHLPRRHCISHVWERLWVENGRQIIVNCEDDETPLEAHIEFESAENAMQLANEALKHIEAKYPNPRRQKIVRIFSLEQQAIAGLHYRMKVEVGVTDCMALSINKDDCKLVNDMNSQNKFCRVNVWMRPWTDHPPSFRVTCDYQSGAMDEIYHHVQAERLFYDFLTTYKPEYLNDVTEMKKRFAIFKENVRKIHELNIYERGTARYAVTRFADMSYEEFSSKYLGLKPGLRDYNQVPMRMAEIPDVELPTKYDWRDYGAVTEVKDQGSCGSCWAFSVTGNIEGQWKLLSGKLVSLSEQELVDCDDLDSGCNGGLPDNAYRSIEKLGGLETENDYPYEGADDKCAFNQSLSTVQISGAVNITSNETDMAKWLTRNGPISIGINANAMQFYVGGISHPWKMLCSPTNLDHGVLIVGYGAKDYPLFHKHLPYWTIKNSWGERWGEQGYYRVYRGDGTCGVNQMASSAVI